jgi:DNA polymerase-4
MRSEGFLASTVVLKIRYNNFDTETKQIKIPYTSFDHILTKTINRPFEKVYTRRMRLRLVRIRFTGWFVGPIKSICLKTQQIIIALPSH